MPRYFKSNELLRIWINKTPDTFMPMTNQLRLIQLRKKNPKAKITLLTAITDPSTGAPFLTPAAEKALRAFCSRPEIQIELLDISEVKTLLRTETERELFEKICQETTKARDNTYGNLAAASDMLRALAEILRRGSYSDYDTKVTLSGLPDVVPVETTASILQSGFRHILEDMGGNRNTGIETNIDLLVPTFPDKACTKLDEAFLQSCNRVQRTILNRYKNLAEVFEGDNFFDAAMQVPAVNAELTPLLKHQDIFGMRRWISEKLTYEVWWQIKKQATRTIVINTLMPSLQTYALRLKMSFQTLLSALDQSDELCAVLSQTLGCTPNFIKFFTDTHEAKDLWICNIHGLSRMKESSKAHQIGGVDFSQYERLLAMSTEEWLQHQYTSNRRSLLKASVQAVTGPYSWCALFKEDVAKITLAELKRLDTSAIAAQTVITRSGDRVLLSQCLLSLQTPETHYDLGVIYQGKRNIEDCLGLDGGADFSWLPSGERILLDQHAKMEHAAKTIQHAYRQYRAHRLHEEPASRSAPQTAPAAAERLKLK